MRRRATRGAPAVALILMAGACGASGPVDVEADAGRPISGPSSTTAPPTTSPPTPTPTSTTEEPTPATRLPDPPPTSAAPSPVPDLAWTAIEPPVNGATWTVQYQPWQDGFIAHATSVSETRTRDDDRLYMWSEADGWTRIDMTNRQFALRSKAFDGRRALVPVFVEPPEDHHRSGEQAHVEVTDDLIGWRQVALPWAEATGGDHTLYREWVVDVAVHDGRFLVAVLSFPAIDRSAVVDDLGVGRYLDWQLVGDVVRMWSSRDEPEGPYRGASPAVEVPVEELGLTDREIAILAATTSFDPPTPVTRLLWSDDGVDFRDASVPLAEGHDARFEVLHDHLVAAVQSEFGGYRILTSARGAEWERRSDAPVEITALGHDGRRLYGLAPTGSATEVWASNPALDAWAPIGTIDHDVGQLAAGEAGLVAAGWSATQQLVLLSPDGTNWRATPASELFGFDANATALVGREHILLVAAPPDAPHRTHLRLARPTW